MKDEKHATFDDPLLQCLVILSKLLNQPTSAEALKAGLPLVNNRFTPELFIRAAQRANLSARLIKRRLPKLKALVLPAVLLLKDGQACILLNYLDKKNVQIILPSTGVLELSVKDLKANYSGYALLARSAYSFDARTEDSLIPRPHTWFWGTLLKSWFIYSEVIIASLLINLFALASPLFVMNVYDRVVPNHAIETLWVLAIGVVIVFGFDFIIRTLRGYFVDIAGKKTDILLGSMIFEQVLGTRRIAHPRSVGAFANHLHEFESFRDFFTSALYAMPLVIAFSILIQFPLRKVIQHTFRASAQKHALLVETLAGMETIKTTRAEGEIQRRWEQLIGQIANFSLKSRFLSALSVNFSLFVQQMSTVVIIVYGVYLIAEGECEHLHH